MRRLIADLVRQIVHARRGVSRNEVTDWVRQFIDEKEPVVASTVISEVIDLLCEMKDIGYGTIRGEPVLVAIPERRVALPDNRVIALGDHGMEMAPSTGLLFPEVSGGATESLIEFIGRPEDPATGRQLEAIVPNGQWTGDYPMPRSLRRALLLCGTFDPPQLKWSISTECASFLNDWFDATPTRNAKEGADLADQSQKRVANAPAENRMVVEAGPGTGKTHVACERVVALVQKQGIAPSRILLLSFTRIAVAELRNRIGQRLKDVPGLAALQITTFDSFAARLLSNAGESLTGRYDANIRLATRLMRSDNPLISDTFGQLEHLVIDEAQDLVGDRREMCKALIDLMHSTCGITILGDFAQSIYGYQRTGLADTTLLDEVAKRGDFVTDRLDRDHRTKTETLRNMFGSVRKMLREFQGNPKDGYFEVRDHIRLATIENDRTGFALHPSTTRGLILTRSRRALHTAAEELRAVGRNFRLRLPERPLRIEPWIGAMLGGFTGSTRLSRDQIVALHEALSPAPPRDAEKCWEVLFELDGSGRQLVSVGRVAESLADPPIELLCDYEGTSGPLLSTIHAIKGHEADRVMMLLSRAPTSENIDWAEEARILYVGATRASEELRIGWISPRSFFRVGDSERHWSPRNENLLIEIGLEGDLSEWSDLVDSGDVTNERDTIADIWRASTEVQKADAFLDAKGRLIVRTGGPAGPVIACLSKVFAEAIQIVRKVDAGSQLPQAINGISVVGATTVAVPARSGDEPSIALMPLLGGFAKVPR
jgi:DNA helicase-2/ATP-dependent DNA helicase PcrA